MEDKKFTQFVSGEMNKAYEYFGSNSMVYNGVSGVMFRVYAPYAKEVRLIGDFTSWTHSLEMIHTDGNVYEYFVEGAATWDNYKFEILTGDNKWIKKADPFAFHSTLTPDFNSVVYSDNFCWNDNEWLLKRKNWNFKKEAVLIYEVHLGSWQKEVGDNFLNYRQIAERLIPYCIEMGYTHLELLPICEHPYLGSWGYQQTGYFSATSRYGTPEDLKYLINLAHEHNIGVILDFVPAHFCKDEHGLYMFDGGNVFDYSSVERRENVLWGTANFDVGKGEVKSFLLASLDYWISEFHFDGVRFDAISYLIYRNGDMSCGENAEGIELIKHLNGSLKALYNDVLLIAEDSSSYPNVTKPLLDGGLGYDMKWDLGYANDHFKYMKTPYIFRKNEANYITFSNYYAHKENYILPFSHDEVVHGKGSMFLKQTGSDDEKFASLQVEYAFFLTHPGKKLMFMGNEFAMRREWADHVGIDWHLINEDAGHKEFFESTKKLFQMYRNESSFFELDFEHSRGFWWNIIDEQNSVYAFFRQNEYEHRILCIFNFDNQTHDVYPFYVEDGEYEDIFTGHRYNSDNGKIILQLKRLSYYFIRKVK